MPTASPGVPDEVRRFVLTSIPSVPFVEALLLLHRDPSRRWSAQQLAQELYTGEKTAADLLVKLKDAGMAEAVGDGRYCYHPARPELAERIDALAYCYTRNLVAISDLIHSRLDRRAQQFADAFRWKKDS